MLEIAGPPDPFQGWNNLTANMDKEGRFFKPFNPLKPPGGACPRPVRGLLRPCNTSIDTLGYRAYKAPWSLVSRILLRLSDVRGLDPNDVRDSTRLPRGK